MMLRWRLFQAAIVLAVIFSNIHWEWTPNNYVAGLFGWLAAWGGTWLIFHRGNWREASQMGLPKKGERAGRW